MDVDEYARCGDCGWERHQHPVPHVCLNFTEERLSASGGSVWEFEGELVAIGRDGGDRNRLAIVCEDDHGRMYGVTVEGPAHEIRRFGRDLYGRVRIRLVSTPPEGDR